MKPCLNGIFKQKLVPEPEASTQSVYNALNAVVEVLADEALAAADTADAAVKAGAGPAC